ncbi:MAG: EpsI family protein [Thermodesulfobacteria bacterium]|nr:EpsI family protein [Thermodesulfobacteriota bacterium]
MIKKALLLVVLLLAFSLLLEGVSTQHPIPLKKSLALFPKEIDGFHFKGSSRMSPKVEKVLGVDDYIMWDYCKGNRCVSLYIGFFEEQQEGAMIHSPKHCMPGGGWLPTSDEIIIIKTPRGEIPVNRFVLQKGERKLLVYYWYQGRGRIVADEYRDRLYLLFDRLFKRRSDGALVRLITKDTPGADAFLQEFVKALLPVLEEYLPS